MSASDPQRQVALGGFLFLSGAAGLIYEVLWLKELGLLFGSSAHAASTTLSVFFLGLALGGAAFGQWAPRVRRPLLAYAWLEVGIAASALLYFLLLDLYYLVYDPLYRLVDTWPLAWQAARVGLAVVVLLPPAFLMGGTLPILGQHLVRRSGELGRTGSWLYGVNTAGAAFGAFVAGFYLPATLGFAGAYAVAIGLSLLVALGMWALSRSTTALPADPPRKEAPRSAGTPTSLPRLWFAVAGVSGALALGLEVLWTRMFSQVLQNSVYTFSTILVVFLGSLAAGSALANRLCRLSAPPLRVLWVLLTLSGLAVAATPFVFFDLSDGLRSLSTGSGWSLYIVSIFVNTGLLLGLPVMLLGSVLPYLLRAVEGARMAPGTLIGRLSAVNTGGGVLGSLLAGFVLLEWLGLWNSVRLAALCYLLAGFFCAWQASSRRWVPAATLLAGVVLLSTWLDASRLPLVYIDAERDEQVLASWEGADGVVAVVERDTGLRIKVNNFYALGGTAALNHEQNQALLPLMPHPAPDSVFFLGLGTGITAGAALRHDTERVVVCELLPDVITAASSFFNDAATRLFTDPRASVLPCDGRNHLRGTTDTYDAVVADLFIPWRVGVGSLYSREHFEAVRERLNPGGIFVQWLPLYQVTRLEFELVARTMLDTFEQVTLWRGDFFPSKPIVALVGAPKSSRLDRDAIVRNGRHLGQGRTLSEMAYLGVTLPFYAGNLTAASELIPPGPINTDDRPVIEYVAPVSHRNQRAGTTSWFTGVELVGFLDALERVAPPEADPHLADLSEKEWRLVSAGHSYYKAAVADRLGDEEAADAHFQRFASLVPFEFRPSVEDAEVYSDFAQ